MVRKDIRFTLQPSSEIGQAPIFSENWRNFENGRSFPFVRGRLKYTESTPAKTDHLARPS